MPSEFAYHYVIFLILSLSFGQISSRDYSHLNDLSQLQFLVIDEADRMIQQGSFPQLEHILDAVHRDNPMDEDEGSEDEPDMEDVDIPDRLYGLPGVPGEARVEMLSEDILLQVERQRTGELLEMPEVKEVDDDEFQRAQMHVEGDLSEEEISLPPPPPIRRQTFVYSATLTLPASGKFIKTNKRLRIDKNIDGAIVEILEKSKAKGKTKVVDLTNADKSGKGKASLTHTSKNSQVGKAKINDRQFRLPPGLRLQQIKCTQKHKDSHLYGYLMNTSDGTSGPALVFCNSIAGVRRVAATLQTLGLSVRVLHAQMQQVSSIQ